MMDYGKITRYEDGKAYHRIEQFRYYDLEGDIDVVIKKLKDLKWEYTAPGITCSYDHIGGGPRASGVFTFTKLSLEKSTGTYDDDDCLILVGERDFTPQEQVIYDTKVASDHAATIRRKREQLEQLKKELGE